MKPPEWVKGAFGIPTLVLGRGLVVATIECAPGGARTYVLRVNQDKVVLHKVTTEQEAKQRAHSYIEAAVRGLLYELGKLRMSDDGTH